MAFRRRTQRRTGRRRPLRWTADCDQLTIDPILSFSNNSEGAAALLMDSGTIAPTGADPLESDGCTLTRIRGSITPNFALNDQTITDSVFLRYNCGILVQDRNGGVDFTTQNPFDEDEDMSVFDWLWTAQKAWRLYQTQVEIGGSLSLDFLEYDTIVVDIKAQRKLRSLNSCLWFVHFWTASNLTSEATLQVGSRYLLRMLVRT